MCEATETIERTICVSQDELVKLIHEVSKVYLVARIGVDDIGSFQENIPVTKAAITRIIDSQPFYTRYRVNATCAGMLFICTTIKGS